MWCRPPCQWRWFILWMIVFMCLYILKPKVLWPLNVIKLALSDILPLLAAHLANQFIWKYQQQTSFKYWYLERGRKSAFVFCWGFQRSKMIQHSMQHCKLWYIQDLLSFKVYMYIYLNIYLYWCLNVILLTDTFDNHNLNTLCTSSATWAREL